jgi:hypothetical protein
MNRIEPQAGFFDNVSVYFDEAASFTQHPKGLLDQFKTCNSLFCASSKKILVGDSLTVKEEPLRAVPTRSIWLIPVSRSRWLSRTTRFGKCGKQIRRFPASGQQRL